MISIYIWVSHINWSFKFYIFLISSYIYFIMQILAGMNNIQTEQKKYIFGPLLDVAYPLAQQAHYIKRQNFLYFLE